MGNERKKLRFEVFFERFFGNFHRIILINLLFAVPSAVVFTAFYFINQAIFGTINIAFSMLSILFIYPFYSGVVMAARDIARGDEGVSVPKVFLQAIKSNFPRFMLHGLAVCAAVMFSYYSLRFYIGMLSYSWLMYGILFVCLIIVLLALFTSFYIPLMDVTYKLRLRDLYKNSVLMSFGEFKNNFFALLAITVVSAIFFTATAFPRNVTLLLIIFGAMWALLAPSTFTYCYCFFVYDGMTDVIRNKGEKVKEIDSKLSDIKGHKADKPSAAQIEEDFSDIDISSLKDTDDFIFHNGRMIKQSSLLRILREKENGEVSPDE